MTPSRAASLVLFCLVAACGENNAAPTPTVPSCQANNTASVRFGNVTAATTLDIYWDGLKVATLAAGQTSAPVVVSAAVAHRLDFVITNTTRLACVTSNPIPSQCATGVYNSCAYP
jgi:hypothetical protein